MRATVGNMKKWEEWVGANPRVAGNVCFAYSPTTGDRYSASSGDYFMHTDEDVLVDSEGQPMILAVESCEISEVDA